MRENCILKTRNPKVFLEETALHSPDMCYIVPPIIPTKFAPYHGRSGPHLTNVTEYEHWCLMGLLLQLQFMIMS